MLASTQPAAVAERLSRPAGDWQWSQEWQNLVFLHWPASVDTIREMLPRGLDLDLWEGKAWVSLVAFRLAEVRLHGLPPLVRCPSFLELNLRTYVRFRGQPGIFFISMHAGSRMTVALARWLTPLPYRHARLDCRREGQAWRWDCRGASQPLLAGLFRPTDEPRQVALDSLDGWLLERYRAFVPDRRGTLRRMAVEHWPWVVQTIDCAVIAAGALDSCGIALQTNPFRGHFARSMPAHVWPFERVV